MNAPGLEEGEQKKEVAFVSHRAGKDETPRRSDAQPGVLLRDDRIRISERLKGRVYVETLREWLLRAKCTEVIASLQNANILLDDVKARYGQIVIKATRLIQFG